MPAEFTLGIDFGTSTTAVALREPGKPPIALPIGRDEVTTYMPSVVAFRQPGNQILLGEEAEQATGAAFVVRSIKRCLGCDGSACSKTGKSGLSGCNGTGSINIPGSNPMKPEQIAAMIVEEAVKRAVRAARNTIGLDLVAHEVALAQEVNLGCGAAFSLIQRQLLVEQVAHKLGFQTVNLRHIVEEPIAAGISYAKLAGVTSGRVLIYDFGGGTFDTAILDVDVQASRITILAADGVPWLGGDDIDQLVYAYFLTKIAEENGLTQDQLKTQLTAFDQQNLRRMATAAKESLSSQTEFEEALFSDSLGVILLDLSRSHLEKLVQENRQQGRNLLERSLDCVLSTYRAAQTFELARKGRLLDTSELMSRKLEDMVPDIDQVVLVGGVTRMPLVRQRLIDLFGQERVVSQDVVEPINAVAVGLAYPREFEQFSLLRPPYAVELVLYDQPKGPQEIIILHQAYDKMDYFSKLTYNVLPIYATPKQHVERSYKHARLRFRGEGIQPNEINLDHKIGQGDHFVCLDLGGRMQLNGIVTPEKMLCHVPLKHPLQEGIIQAQRERPAPASKRDPKKEIEDFFREN
ncbi:MAG: Hsp70 family protein [Anaerolineae bacterium]|nr:Hsp70 family protein [Anaerolineae bacterium]